MPIYDYRCLACGIFEAMRGVEDSSTPCPICSQLAEREAVYPIALGTKEKKYRVSDFKEASQELDYAHTRAERREGRKLKFPNLYREGRA